MAFLAAHYIELVTKRIQNVDFSRQTTLARTNSELLGLRDGFGLLGLVTNLTNNRLEDRDYVLGANNVVIVGVVQAERELVFFDVPAVGQSPQSHKKVVKVDVLHVVPFA